MKRAGILIISIIISNALLFAEEYTLQKCIDTAVKNNPQVKVAEQKLIVSSARRGEAFSGYLPKLNAVAVYTKLSEPTFKLSPAVAAMFSLDPSMTSDNLYIGKLTLTQPLFMWGKLRQFNKQAGLGYDISLEDLRKTKNEIILAVKQTFYGYLLTKKMNEISKEAFSVTEEHYRVAQAFYDDGRISTYDVSQGKVAMLNAKSNMVRAENGLALSKAALINLLNLPETEAHSAEFTGELEFMPVEPNLEILQADALKNRPEIKQLELTEQINKSLVSVSKADNKPVIALSGNYTMQYGLWDTDLDKWQKKWDTSLAISMPIFDGMASHNRVKQAKANLEQIRITREQAEQGIMLEVEQAYLTLIQNKNIITAQKENMETALDNLEIAKKRYAEGLMSSLEIRDAQLSTTMAETNYFQSLAEYEIALAKLDKAVGK